MKRKSNGKIVNYKVNLRIYSLFLSYKLQLAYV
jgi:hypothetical protein